MKITIFAGSSVIDGWPSTGYCYYQLFIDKQLSGAVIDFLRKGILSVLAAKDGSSSNSIVLA